MTSNSIFLIAALALSGEDASLPTIGDLDAEAKDFAKAAHLKPLAKSRNAREVRVWQTISLADLAYGWVVTEGEIRRYSNERIVNGVTFGGTRLRLVETRRLPDASSILRRFDALAPLAGTSIDCHIFDGAPKLVEVKHGETTFVLKAMNPRVCKTDRERTVDVAIGALFDALGD